MLGCLHNYVFEISLSNIVRTTFDLKSKFAEYGQTVSISLLLSSNDAILYGQLLAQFLNIAKDYSKHSNDA